jgi:hypothetical protein
LYELPFIYNIFIIIITYKNIVKNIIKSNYLKL